MEKYIFLDFDGVINTQNDKFDKNAMANLRRLLEKTDAKVVISSTWRLQGMEYIQQLWQEHHMQGEVIGLTPSCNSTNFSNVDGKVYSAFIFCRLFHNCIFNVCGKSIMKVCQLLTQVEKTSIFVSFYKKNLTCIDN